MICNSNVFFVDNPDPNPDPKVRLMPDLNPDPGKISDPLNFSSFSLFLKDFYTLLDFLVHTYNELEGKFIVLAFFVIIVRQTVGNRKHYLF